MAKSTAKRVSRLIGESLREIAILIAVFVPLEFFVQQVPLTATNMAGIMSLVVFFSGLGIYLEIR